MRRGKDLRDHREALRRRAATERARRRQGALKTKASLTRQKNREKLTQKIAKETKMVSRNKVELSIVPYDEYQPKRQMKVCHIIDSLGLGGGQTMMMELFKALEKYYPDFMQGNVVCPRPNSTKWERTFYQSYGLEPDGCRERELNKYLSVGQFDVALHHRLAVSKCLRPAIPDKCKYVLLNHTYHQLARVPKFLKCDFYISVCNYLDKETRWNSAIHPSRRMVILNGVENAYIADLPPSNLEGTFKTGRCHRLVQSKFKPDSLDWMERKVTTHIKGFSHYLMGHHPEAKRKCKRMKACHYLGLMNKRAKKMAVIKELDTYFYETFQQEGASMAILESLACSVPVLCKDYGGNAELIKNGVNGFVVKDRDDFLLRMKDLSQNPEKLNALKESTRKDFETRLHIKHTASKYMQVFESLLS